MNLCQFNSTVTKYVGLTSTRVKNFSLTPTVLSGKREDYVYVEGQCYKHTVRNLDKCK
jgi:hypothetical protein